MRRVVFSALAGLLAATSASAQLPTRPIDPGPRLRITPFVGQAPQFERDERWTLSNGMLNGTVAMQTSFASGSAVGGVLDARLTERFGFVASGVYISRKATVDFETGDVAPGSNFLLAKAGISLRLHEPISEMQMRQLTASIFAAPALVREMPKEDLSLADPTLDDPINHYGLNLGVETEIPLNGNSIALQLAAEDFIVWWNESELAERLDAGAGLSGSVVDTDPSHMWVFRAGLTFRVR